MRSTLQPPTAVVCIACDDGVQRCRGGCDLLKPRDAFSRVELRRKAPTCRTCAGTALCSGRCGHERDRSFFSGAQLERKMELCRGCVTLVLCHGPCGKRRSRAAFSGRALQTKVPRCRRCETTKTSRCHGPCGQEKDDTAFSPNQLDRSAKTCKQCVADWDAKAGTSVAAGIPAESSGPALPALRVPGDSGTGFIHPDFGCGALTGC